MNPILTDAKQLLHKEEKNFIYFKMFTYWLYDYA